MRVRRASLFIVAVAALMSSVASGLPAGPALGAPSGTTGIAAPARARGWPGKPAKPAPVRPRQADPEAAIALRKSPAVSWPAAGVAEIAVPSPAMRAASAGPALARAGNLPVWVGPAGGAPGARASAADPGTARVEVFDRATTARTGTRGLLLRVGHTDRKARPLAVEVDYTGFRQAYGGDYGSRLTLVRLPDCALSTPQASGCAAATPVTTRNGSGSGRLRAEVTDGLFAVAAVAEGSVGSFKPTTLSPSATWQVGLQSGAFEWSYPMPAPALPGLVPEVNLSYSSGSVDGRVASTNNQPSWVGEGFDYQPGFIERSYQRCSEDGQAATIGDLCWASDNATVVLPGLTGELVRDSATGVWRAERDNGWRVERIEPAGGGTNGANKGEYWRLTSPDGTQYFFGLDKLPEASSSALKTNSTWTVPVFGNNSGEPCNKSTFDTSWCQQAYRWNLDFVVNRHNDVMSYWYAPETNYYGRNGRSDLPTPYVRGGQLSRIEYGQRVGSVYTTPAPGRVVFTPAERCVPGTSCVTSQPQNYPDTPLDQSCGATSCRLLSPTFWTTRRLAKVATQVYTGGAPQDVDSWTLGQSYPVPGDNTAPALWLDSITHAGHAGGVTTTLPAVTFDGATDENRVDGDDARPAMYKRRISRVYSETGGELDVAYAPPECGNGTLPAVDLNQRRCFPAIWGTSPTEDWFHKYVVTQVAEVDLVGGNPNSTRFTSYQYDFGAPGWHHDDAELVQAGRKSWGQWRGYQKVSVRTGGAGAPRTLTEHLFLQGMNGDLRKPTSPPADGLTVDGVPDEPKWSGFARSVSVYDGDGGALVSRTVSEPADLGVTAQRPRTGGTPGTLAAHLTDVKWEKTLTPTAGGGTRTSMVSYAFDARGRLTQAHDQGDLADPADDTCAQTEYAENLTDWVINAVKRQVTLGIACGATASYPADLLSDRRYYHDGSAVWGAAPSKGDVTRVEEATSWSGGAPVYVTTGRTEYDAQGRPVKDYDALDHLTQTTYTPAVGGPVTRTLVTDALNFTTSTGHDPLRGNPLTTTDANNNTTTMAYDPLGRLTKVWLPGRATTASANLEYAYAVRTDGPNAVQTRALQAGSTYKTSYELYDGFLRARQTQQPSPTGGRVVTDTLYDGYGRVATVLEPRYDPDPIGAELAPPPETVEAQTSYEYDGAGRETAKTLLVAGQDPARWRTTRTYQGDRVSIDPPAGDTARTEISDAHGRLVGLREYAGGAPSGAYDETRYTYTRAGKLATVTDPAGNAWRYSYDLRGRQTRVEAPDTGVSSTTFDAQGQVLTSTDARGQVLAYAYDALNRRTAVHSGSLAGPKLAAWSYDTATLGKGRLAASLRYADNRTYENRVTSYDARGRRSVTAVVIPAGETGLTGTYPVTYTYDEADKVTSTALPAVGDLPAETLQHGYDSVGSPKSLRTGTVTYAYDTTYTPLGEPEKYVLGAAGKQVTRLLGYEPGTRQLSSAAATTTGGARLTDVGYGYDPAGNVTRIADASTADDQCFRYDQARRLTEAWTATDACAGTPRLAALGGPAPYWHSYQYDRLGNRTGEVRHAAGGDTTRTYGYPSVGAAQPHTLRTVTSAGPGGARTDSYGYDPAGNTTTRPGGAGNQSLTWDVEGHLASVTEAAAGTSYVYDADGALLIRRDPTGVTLYLDDTELRVEGGTARGTRYYQHGPAVVAVRTAGKLSWLVPDAHGTAGVAVDAATLAATRRYDLPFGDRRGPAVSGWPGERGFVGGVAEPSTGLTRLGAREYDAGSGRFLSADPVVDHQDPQQVNGYAYASNNPTSFTDPDGRLVMKPQFGVRTLDRLVTGVGSAEPMRASTDPVPKTTCNGAWCSIQGELPEVDERNSWPDVYPYFDVYPKEYGRDVRPSPVYSCSGADPGPAMACMDRPPTGPQVELMYLERDCLGWNQCISPRPFSWTPVEFYYEQPPGPSSPTPGSPLFGGGGLLSVILRPPTAKSPLGSAGPTIRSGSGGGIYAG